EDEEGRALVIEERYELLDDERRRELGIRHRMALDVRSGADWVESVRFGLAFGLTPRESVRIAARIHRGGGLAREVIYLPAWERVTRAFDADPTLEAWLERGRVSVDAARILDGAAEVPTRFDFVRESPPSDQANVASTGA